MKKITALFGAFIILSLYSCQKASDIYSFVDCDFDIEAAPKEETDSLKRWLDNNGIAATLHEKGFYYIIDSVGNDKRMEHCYDMYADYKVNLLDYSFVDKGTNTYLRMYQLIDGWQLGTTLIGEGGKIRLFLPPTLGYGADGKAPAIGKNEYLMFEIKLISFTRNTTM